MKTKKEIEQDVMKTLASLDDVEDINVSPFFSTRVQARIQAMEQQKTRSPRRRVFGMAQLRVAGILVLLVMNLAAFVSLLQTSQVQTNDRQTILSAFADEYGFAQQDDIALFE